ncbi:unnamed protein product [Adineta ricciae]|uniref:Uncharacterized protein n=1 Tax=Adineta ricciae TaxID=249248 RepID=A0A815K4R3_ADIRI|nr:unnamed protein product [Adineta ricciae]CAF1461453.1 unnamed protein product [Adineta ricciae]
MDSSTFHEHYKNQNQLYIASLSTNLNMNSLYMDNIFLNFKELIIQTLNIDCYCFGSDPLTHKKIREEQSKNDMPEQISSNQSVTSSPSSGSPTSLNESYEEQSKPSTKFES